MELASVHSIKYKPVKVTLLCSYFLLLTQRITCQESPKDILVQDILYTQEQAESDDTICMDGQSIFAPIDDGGASSYFNYKFADLKSVIQEKTGELKQLEVTERIGPNTAVSEAVHDIKNADSQRVIVEIVLLLGDSNQPLHCYKDGSYSTCIDEYKQIYADTKRSTWIYHRSCEEWRATYRNSEVRVLPSVVKVVPSVTFTLKKSDINQCPGSADGEFSGTALCPADSTECKHLNGSGFRVGSYQCICTECPDCDPIDGVSLSLHAYDGDQVDASVNSLVNTYVTKHCTKQEGDKGYKGSLSQGEITYLDKVEIYVMLGIQAVCIIICLVFAVIVVIKKSSRVIQSSKPLVLGLILFGAILKYITILCMFLNPTRRSVICILQPWLSEVGFICMFGAIVLKTYKSLAEFQTRKARRVHIRDKDLLKYWSVCLLLVVIYLASYTAVTLNLVTTQNASLVETLTSDTTELSLSISSDNEADTDAKCRIFWSNYVTQITEILFVAFGFYMATRLRSAPSLYWENRWYAAALLVELITSIIYYIISDLLVSNSYYSFIVYFVYLQLSVTVALLLVFCPKLCYLKKAPAGDGVFLSGTGNRTDLVDFRTHGPAANGEIDIDEINIESMSPEEIKKELRRVYEQLQTLKVKVMRYENPHLQGKRGHSKSKLPFYKQISKHGTKKSAGRGSAADVSEDAELEPLHTPQTSSNTTANERNSSSHAKESSQLSF